MRWKGRQGSRNVEDRRGQSAGGNIFGRRSGGGMPRGRSSIGCGGIIILLLVLFFFGGGQGLFTGDTSQMPQTQQEQYQGQNRSQTNNRGGVSEQGRPDDDLAQFVSVVLRETELVWDPIFKQQLGRNYQYPTLVLFDGSVRSACGMASSATGPFYCPADSKLYIDLSFYRDLSQKFGAPGDFAMAYVVAHEVAHHVQNQLGITNQVQSQRGRISQSDYNELSVKLELQADFLSGVWARHVQQKGLLEEGDIEEALRCANAIGDDRIQKQARGYVVPDSFTHGTSEQRMRWFRKGYETGDLNQGDTFNARYL